MQYGGKPSGVAMGGRDGERKNTEGDGASSDNDAPERRQSCAFLEELQTPEKSNQEMQKKRT